MAQTGLSARPPAGFVIEGKAAVFSNKPNRPVLTRPGHLDALWLTVANDPSMSFAAYDEWQLCFRG